VVCPSYRLRWFRYIHQRAPRSAGFRDLSHPARQEGCHSVRPRGRR